LNVQRGKTGTRFHWSAVDAQGRYEYYHGAIVVLSAEARVAALAADNRIAVGVVVRLLDQEPAIVVPFADAGEAIGILRDPAVGVQKYHLLVPPVRRPNDSYVTCRKPNGCCRIAQTIDIDRVAGLRSAVTRRVAQSPKMRAVAAEGVFFTDFAIRSVIKRKPRFVAADVNWDSAWKQECFRT